MVVWKGRGLNIKFQIHVVHLVLAKKIQKSLIPKEQLIDRQIDHTYAVLVIFHIPHYPTTVKALYVITTGENGKKVKTEQVRTAC